MTDKTPRTMNYLKAEYSIFEATAKELGLTQVQLSKALGYSDTAGHKWASEGKIPAVTALACECLRRRRGQAGYATTWYLAKTTTDAQKSALEAVCKGLGVEFTNL